MSNVNNTEHKACFCDGSCMFNGICGDKTIPWYGPNRMYPGQIEEIEKAFQTTTTGFKPTVAEELRRKADLAQRDKRAEARAKYELIYSNIQTYLQEQAAKGQYFLRARCPEFQTLTRDEFNDFMEYLIELGFSVEEEENRLLYIDWQDHREAPPTTESVKQYESKWHW